MKILYYSAHPNLHLELASGPGTHMREIIREFGEAGHEVIPVIMGDVPKPTAGTQGTAQPNLKSRIRKFIPSLIWQTMKDMNLRRFDNHAKACLEDAVATHQPDLIYERAYYLMTSGVQVAKEKGISHILELNAPYPEEKAEMEGRSLLQNAAKKAEQMQLQLTSLVVVVSSALKDYVDRRCPGIAAKTLVVPNAIRPAKFEQAQTQSLHVRRNLGIPNDALVFGFVGSIFPYHGVGELIDAFLEVADNNSHLLVVGDGEILPDLRLKAAQSELAKRIHFTGKVEPHKIPEIIGAMDVCIMARSNWYGSPVKIFEYGAMNKAIIAPRNVPVMDAMTKQDGLLIATQDELIEAMKQLQQDDALRKTLAAHFFKRVYANFTWKQVAQKTLRALEEQQGL